jgi:hypothetical protein
VISSQPPDPDQGKRLRQVALSTRAGRLRFSPDAEFPVVYGLLMDWNLGEECASVVALRDGTASLYTTSAFGIIGGQAHPAVQRAAVDCVTVAARFLDASKPVTEFPYPPEGFINFYMLTYAGVRHLLGDEAAYPLGSDPTHPLFLAAQEVLTQLRIATTPQAP